MLAEPKCRKRNCKHFQGVYNPTGGWDQKSNETFDEGQERPACAAFPEGIPHEIAYGDNKHLTPFPGDHGILYEKKEDSQPQQ